MTEMTCKLQNSGIMNFPRLEEQMTHTKERLGNQNAKLNQMFTSMSTIKWLNQEEARAGSYQSHLICIHEVIMIWAQAFLMTVMRTTL